MQLVEASLFASCVLPLLRLSLCGTNFSLFEHVVYLSTNGRRMLCTDGNNDP